MKSFLVVIFVAHVVLQTTSAQVIRSITPSIIDGCGCGGYPACGQTCGCGPSIIAPSAIPATIVQSNSVAASLADTLSLLTVSSLLAETLPCGCGGCGGYGCGGCGGYGCGGCGGYGYGGGIYGCGGCGGPIYY